MFLPLCFIFLFLHVSWEHVCNIFFYLLFLAVLHSWWDSPTRDWTCALGSESVESQPLDHRGIPKIYIYFFYWRLSCISLFALPHIHVRTVFLPLLQVRKLRSKKLHVLPNITKLMRYERINSSFLIPSSRHYLLYHMVYHLNKQKCFFKLKYR